MKSDATLEVETEVLKEDMKYFFEARDDLDETTSFLYMSMLLH